MALQCCVAKERFTRLMVQGAASAERKLLSLDRKILYIYMEN
jgi:hypothetical protein